MVIRIFIGLFAGSFAFATPAQRDHYKCLAGLVAYNRAATGNAMYSFADGQETYITNGQIISRTVPKPTKEIWNSLKCNAKDDCRVDPTKHDPPSNTMEVTIKTMISLLFENVYLAKPTEKSRESHARAILACENVRDIKYYNKPISVAVATLKKKYAAAIEQLPGIDPETVPTSQPSSTAREPR